MDAGCGGSGEVLGLTVSSVDLPGRQLTVIDRKFMIVSGSL
jgi:hypothetical protein